MPYMLNCRRQKSKRLKNIKEVAEKVAIFVKNINEPMYISCNMGVFNFLEKLYN